MEQRGEGREYPVSSCLFVMIHRPSMLPCNHRPSSVVPSDNVRAPSPWYLLDTFNLSFYFPLLLSFPLPSKLPCGMSSAVTKLRVLMTPIIASSHPSSCLSLLLPSLPLSLPFPSLLPLSYLSSLKVPSNLPPRVVRTPRPWRLSACHSPSYFSYFPSANVSVYLTSIKTKQEREEEKRRRKGRRERGQEGRRERREGRGEEEGRGYVPVPLRFPSLHCPV